MGRARQSGGARPAAAEPGPRAAICARGRSRLVAARQSTLDRVSLFYGPTRADDISGLFEAHASRNRSLLPSSPFHRTPLEKSRGALHGLGRAPADGSEQKFVKVQRTVKLPSRPSWRETSSQSPRRPHCAPLAGWVKAVSSGILTKQHKYIGKQFVPICCLVRILGLCDS